jgi:PEP-CTERM motif
MVCPANGERRNHFPGTIACPSNCFFDVLLFTPAANQFVQVYAIGATDNLNITIAAYLNSFDPANQATNYLGDAAGGILLDSQERTFRVFVPNGQQLALVFSNFPANGGTGFGTVNYEIDGVDIIALPEPATLAIVGLGLAGLVGFRRFAKW